jgi:hypothetical protein
VAIAEDAIPQRCHPSLVQLLAEARGCRGYGRRIVVIPLIGYYFESDEPAPFSGESPAAAVGWR